MSALDTYQRALVTLAFSEDDVARPALPGFEIYREMIRARLFAMARVAFARSFALAARPDARAAQPLEACFARYLAEAPPTSPLIREVIADFAPFAERAFGAPSQLTSLLRFEAAKWRVASLPYTPVQDVSELDFAGVLVVNPTLLAVALDHRVAEDDPSGEPDRHTLLVYRRAPDAADGDRVLWSRAPRVAALLADADPDSTLGSRVARFFASGGDSADEAGLLRLADELTVAAERGILLGVRPLDGRRESRH
jgi:hypothetical protein